MNRIPKIPTIIALLLLATIVGGIIFVAEQYTRTSSIAGDSAAPTSVEITNINDSTFSVSWITSQAATGIITAKPQQGGKELSGFDDRDTEDKPGKYTTHHVTIRNAAPDTTYLVKILSEGKTLQSTEKPREVKTFPAIVARPTKLEPAYGTIATPEGAQAFGALVYITPEGGQKLSTLTNPSGSWLIPLNLSRTSDGSSYLPATDRLTEEISARMGNLVGTAITDTLNDAPVPEITIGKSYDFRKQQGQRGQASSLATLKTPANPVLGKEVSMKREVTVTAPSEGAALPTLLPIIQGSGIPGKSVYIEASVPKQKGTTTVGDDGRWQFTPQANLAPGKQTVSVISQDENGVGVTVERHFEILKSGTQVLGDATPSGTLIPTPSRSATPSPTLKFSPTPTSTSSGQAPPVSGVYTPTLFLLAAGILLITTGAGLLLHYEP